MIKAGKQYKTQLGQVIQIISIDHDASINAIWAFDVSNPDQSVWLMPSDLII